MKIDLIATGPHFLDHLASIWSALSAEERGYPYIAPTLRSRTHPPGSRWPVVPSSTPTLVASIGDLKRARMAGRPAIYVTHGIGQSYAGTRRNESYPGGRNRSGTVLFLAANERAVEQQRAIYPDVPALAVGVPKLDARHVADPKPVSKPPTVAISFHWDSHVCAETRSSFRWYWGELRRLIAAHPTAIAHAHPRDWYKLSVQMRTLRFKVVQDWNEVMDLADLYITDNSSTLYEFASLGRPVVVLNAPWYRRDVEHGMRFWEWADVGLQVDDPSDLLPAVWHALDDPPPVRARREEIVREAYVATDGKATARAVEAIRTYLG